MVGCCGTTPHAMGTIAMVLAWPCGSAVGSSGGRPPMRSAWGRPLGPALLRCPAPVSGRRPVTWTGGVAMRFLDEHRVPPLCRPSGGPCRAAGRGPEQETAPSWRPFRLRRIWSPDRDELDGGGRGSTTPRSDVGSGWCFAHGGEMPPATAYPASALLSRRRLVARRGTPQPLRDRPAFETGGDPARS
jgi:hypothetical protein